MSDLNTKRCLPCESGVKPLSPKECSALLSKLNDWSINDNHTWIHRRLSFDDFYQTMTFVNAVAFIANKEGHHPDIECGYNYCVIRYQTHAIQGLSENDFICAAKIDALLSA